MLYLSYYISEDSNEKEYSYEKGIKIDNIRFLYRMTTITRKLKININKIFDLKKDRLVEERPMDILNQINLYNMK